MISNKLLLYFCLLIPSVAYAKPSNGVDTYLGMLAPTQEREYKIQLEGGNNELEINTDRSNDLILCKFSNSKEDSLFVKEATNNCHFIMNSKEKETLFITLKNVGQKELSYKMTVK